MAGLPRRPAARRAPAPHRWRIDFQHVTHIGSEVTIGIRRELLSTPPLEDWLRKKIIGRIPEPTMLASDLLGRTVYDASGHPIGHIADLFTSPGPAGRTELRGVLLTPRRRGRLFGYERPGIQGPWILKRITGRLHRGTREIPWHEVRLTPA